MSVRDSILKARAVLEGLGLPEVRVPAPLAELVATGAATVVVQKTELPAGEYRLTDGNRTVRAELGPGQSVNVASLGDRELQHRVSTELRKKLWPKSKTLFLHDVRKVEGRETSASTLVLDPATSTPVQKPFAGFENFGACVLHMQGRGYDEDAARRICGAMQARTEKASSHGGVMVAFRIPEAIAKELALPDGEPAEQLHLTLAYLGKTEELTDLSGVHVAVERVAAATPVLRGSLSGVGRFEASETSDGKDVLYKTVDVPGLVEFRQAVVTALADAGYAVSQVHGFTPHVALKYVDPSESTPEIRGEYAVEFTAVSVVAGNVWKDYPLQEPERSTKAFPITLHKMEGSSEEERYVLGIVLEPDVIDSQGDTYSEEEVRRACHWWMENHAQLGLQHELIVGGVPQRVQLTYDRVRILENYLAPVNFVIGGQSVKKGTWLLAVRVIDDELWEQVKRGELTGYSIGGMSSYHEISRAEAAKLPLAGSATVAA